ncbi:hypothetical protein BV133_3242 [Blastochloris viridis]|uniref:Uncharacterized protein n=1 Tax=Blastochloris viridis TaxID=1079 RepID=A0A182D603_BLAVI|nr:hypothetical protein BV133_3242 [Blastochloris viridis]
MIAVRFSRTTSSRVLRQPAFRVAHTMHNGHHHHAVGLRFVNDDVEASTRIRAIGLNAGRAAPILGLAAASSTLCMMRQYGHRRREYCLRRCPPRPHRDRPPHAG